MSFDAAVYFPDVLASAAERPAPVRGELELPKQRSDEEPPHAGAPSHQAKAAVPIVEISDEELLERIGHGERDALAILFRRHARSVRNIAQRILRDEAEADDLLQDVFLFVFRKAASFDSSRGSARTWVFHVTYHRAFDRRRYLISRHFYSAEELDDDTLRSGHQDQEMIPFLTQSIDGILGRELIARFNARLSEQQRRTIQLYFFEGYTLKEIAEQNGQTLDNVRNYYYRGLERLRKYVLPEKVRSKWTK